MEVKDKKIAETQMEALLTASSEHFKKRNLKMAGSTAQIALDFAKQSENSKYIFDASLSLSKIYGTNGRYANEVSYFEKAHNFLIVSKKLVFKRSVNDEIDFHKALARLYFDEEKNKEALQTYDLALSEATSIKNISAEASIYLRKGYVFLQSSDYQSALEMAEHAEERIHLLSGKNTGVIGNLLKLKALANLKTNEFGKALKAAQSLLGLSKKHEEIEKEIIALNVIAIVSGVKGNFKIATQYFQEALEKSEKIGYKFYIAQCQINIGTIYAQLHNHADALERYDAVLENHQDILDTQTKVAIFNNVGNLNYSRNEFSTAQKYFEDALKMAETNNFKSEKALAKAQLGRTFFALEKFKEAEEFANAAAKDFEQLPNTNGHQINELNLGNIQFKKGLTDEAIKMVEKGIETSKNLQDEVSQITGFQLLSKFYEQDGDFEKAFQSLSNYTELKENFTKKQRNRQFLDLEIKNAIKAKQTEIEQLIKENELQSQLIHKSGEVEQKNRELTSINEDLRQFAYIASHDLKEPLRMISSYAQIVSRLYGDKLDENAKTYFGYMTEGVTRMNGLLDDLLKYATVGRDAGEDELIELDYVVEICRVNLKVLIQESGAEITYEELPVVHATRTTLIQLMQNLISNAIKFRKEGVAPIVEVSCTENKEEYTISVKDNGIGIDKENIERIFVIFQRLHSRTTFPGSGIGLAICQKIVQRWGGTIWVTSELGNGSSFHFTIPKKG